MIYLIGGIILLYGGFFINVLLTRPPKNKKD